MYPVWTLAARPPPGLFRDGSSEGDTDPEGGQGQAREKGLLFWLHSHPPPMRMAAGLTGTTPPPLPPPPIPASGKRPFSVAGTSLIEREVWREKQGRAIDGLFHFPEPPEHSSLIIVTEPHCC